MGCAWSGGCAFFAFRVLTGLFLSGPPVFQGVFACDGPLLSCPVPASCGPCRAGQGPPCGPPASWGPGVRVAIFTPNYLPGTRSGGPVRSTHGLACGLVAQGHDVDILTTDVDGSVRLDVPLDRPVDRDGMRVHYRPVAAPRRSYRSPALARLAGEIIPRVDVVHVNGMFLWPGPQIGRAARRAGKPLVISPRGMLMPDLVAGKSRLLKMLWIAVQERANLAGAAAIHVTAESEAEGLRAMGLDLAPISIIPNGVAVPAALPEPSEVEAIWGDVPRGRRVGFIGRLGWNKGVDLAIEAVRARPGAVLRLAGHDEIGLRAKLEPRLADPGRGGASCSAFIGHIEGRRKWAFLAGADVLLMPSLQENFGNVLIEALAMGTPVIATQGVGASHYLRRLDPGLVVPRAQPALNAALADLLADPDRRARIGRAGQALVRAELQWDSIAAQMARLYRAATTDTAPA